MAASPEKTALAPELAAWTCSACREKLHRAERPAYSEDIEDAEEEVEKELRELEKTMTEDEILSRNKCALKLTEEGDASFKRGQYDDAVMLYTEALRTCPLSLSAVRSVLYLNRVATWLMLGENKLAIKDCSKAIELNPSNLNAILTRAQLNKEMGNLGEALKDYRRVLELDPSNEESKRACMEQEEQERKLRNKKVIKYCAVAAGTGLAVGVGAVVAAPIALAAAGFGTGGVVAGSLAAVIQSSIGNVVAGSAFAALQSWGAVGIPLAAQATFGTVGASMGGALGALGVKLSGRRAQPSDDTKEGNEEKENQEKRKQEEMTHGPDEKGCQCPEHVGRNCKVMRCASCGHEFHSADATAGTGDESTPRG
ncbi:uncharacterized protein LOC144138035 [Haemaphysalis longicornis]